MQNVFQKALNFTLQFEGGFVNHPADPGGPTNKGVTLAVLQENKIDENNDGKSDIEDLKNLSLDSVVQLYKHKYWNKLGLDDLIESHPKLAIAAFDTAVLTGPGRASKWLTTTLDKFEDYPYFLNLRMIHHLEVVKKNPATAVFKKGWLRRVNELKKYLDSLED